MMYARGREHNSLFDLYIYIQYICSLTKDSISFGKAKEQQGNRLLYAIPMEIVLWLPFNVSNKGCISSGLAAAVGEMPREIRTYVAGTYQTNAYILNFSQRRMANGKNVGRNAAHGKQSRVGCGLGFS